ncbi:hypothetical protein IW140_002622 [Coemansia sp. RSA 1813]|nr:hypothetical protein EV178_002050 [Coemansia sp. RSA 1646]KAJ1772679.1 hypothetical protein LPJ74_001205 [Coemansia sp. RSA 1843]KAJ2090630.1 hypothetical protein IW138_002444 [Coemansia sp. RSA 986]KAJ2216165.1 hypothetical protein EV179_001625 [Coemansia sp. RSA 487]KAJ2570152.1 hypothetical protein IW140_002622 [Coemansia sp. RSA 1813]
MENLSEQNLLIQSLANNLKRSDDAQVSRQIMHHVQETQTKRQQSLDTTQETLQQLSRRLQTARTRVDASKAQREAKSHADTMRDLQGEKKTIESSIVQGEKQHELLTQEIAALEKEINELDENVERQEGPDENVLKLHILRSLGVEPLINEQTGAIDVARVWSADSACTVSIDESAQAHQLAAQLWNYCSS